MLMSRDDERSRGQALVEFALVAPLLFLLVIGIFEAGRFILHYEMLNNATREGARYAIVHGCKAIDGKSTGIPGPGCQKSDKDPVTGEYGGDVIGVVERASLDLASSGTLTVSTRWPVNNKRGEQVTVEIDYVYDPLFKTVLGVEFLPSITINAESTLVINN